MRDRKRPSVFKIVFKLPNLLFFPAALILVEIAKSSPEKVESIYSTGIYPIIGQAVSFIFGFFPFSAAEFLLIALVILIPLGLVFNLARKKDSGYYFVNYVVSYNFV